MQTINTISNNILKASKLVTHQTKHPQTCIVSPHTPTRDLPRPIRSHIHAKTSAPTPNTTNTPTHEATRSAGFRATFALLLAADPFTRAEGIRSITGVQLCELNVGIERLGIGVVAGFSVVEIEIEVVGGGIDV